MSRLDEIEARFKAAPAILALGEAAEYDAMKPVRESIGEVSIGVTTDFKVQFVAWAMGYVPMQDFLAGAYRDVGYLLKVARAAEELFAQTAGQLAKGGNGYCMTCSGTQQQHMEDCPWTALREAIEVQR